MRLRGGIIRVTTAYLRTRESATVWCSGRTHWHQQQQQYTTSVGLIRKWQDILSNVNTEEQSRQPTLETNDLRQLLKDAIHVYKTEGAAAVVPDQVRVSPAAARRHVAIRSSLPTTKELLHCTAPSAAWYVRCTMCIVRCIANARSGHCCSLLAGREQQLLQQQLCRRCKAPPVSRVAGKTVGKAPSALRCVWQRCS